MLTNITTVTKITPSENFGHKKSVFVRINLPLIGKRISQINSLAQYCGRLLKQMVKVSEAQRPLVIKSDGRQYVINPATTPQFESWDWIF